MSIYGKKSYPVRSSVFNVQSAIVACGVIVSHHVPDHAVSNSIHWCACIIRTTIWTNPVHAAMPKTMVAMINRRIIIVICMSDQVSVASWRSRYGPSSISEASGRDIISSNKT